MVNSVFWLQCILDVYLLFPINMITMLELECCRASSSHVVRWLNVSLLQKQDFKCNAFIKKVLEIVFQNNTFFWFIGNSKQDLQLMLKPKKIYIKLKIFDYKATCIYPDIPWQWFDSWKYLVTTKFVKRLGRLLCSVYWTIVCYSISMYRALLTKQKDNSLSECQ